VRNLRWIAPSAILAVTALGLLIGWRVKLKQKPSPRPALAISTIFQGPEVTLTGRLQSRTAEQVDAPIAGILDAWFVEIGHEVYEDQLVGRIRNADLDAAVQSAQVALDRAELKIAQSDAQAMNTRLEISRTAADQIRARNELDRIEKIYQRQKNLMEAGAIARLTFEKTEADFNAAKAEAATRDASAEDAQEKGAALQHDSEESKRTLTELTAALAKAKEAVAQGDLHSPADGIVITSNVHQGDKVEESAEALLTIATDLTKLAVSLTPDPPALARIKAGQHAFVRMSDAECPGQVSEVRGQEVIVEFTSPTPVTQLGTAAQVRIIF
jgi:multidrug resistance efflux pump